MNLGKISGHEVTGGRGLVTKPSHGVARQGTVEPKREAFGAKLCLAQKTTRDASGQVTKPSHGVAWQGTVEPTCEACDGYEKEYKRIMRQVSDLPPDAFLMKIRPARLTNPKKYCIIVCGYPQGTRLVLCGIAKNTISGYFEVQNGVFKDM